MLEEAGQQTYFSGLLTLSNLIDGIHWIALAEEYPQMSAHVPGFQTFFQLFCIIL